MTIQSIEIDGKWYHAQPDWPDGQEEPSDKLVPILDEEGDMIPKEQCMCFARSSSECICGAWDIVAKFDWELDTDWDDY